MPDREKVIERLKAMHDFLGIGLSSQTQVFEEDQKILEDAIAMLEEQKHGETFTVIDTKTGEEADEYNIALHEEWAKHLCYCDMEGWAIENDGTLLLVDECGQFAYADRERFKVVWDDGQSNY